MTSGGGGILMTLAFKFVGHDVMTHCVQILKYSQFPSTFHHDLHYLVNSNGLASFKVLVNLARWS